MNIVRYRRLPMPGSLHDEFRQMFDRMLEGAGLDQPAGDESAVVTSQWTPHVDVKEEAGRFVLYADLPGIDPDDIEVSMDRGMLTIRGERTSESSTETERFSRIERRYGSFHRRFALPDSADADGIRAHGRNGVLEITIPKRPESSPRRIQVGRGEPRDHGAIDAPATQQ